MSETRARTTQGPTEQRVGEVDLSLPGRSVLHLYESKALAPTSPEVTRNVNIDDPANESNESNKVRVSGTTEERKQGSAKKDTEEDLLAVHRKNVVQLPAVGVEVDVPDVAAKGACRMRSNVFRDEDSTAIASKNLQARPCAAKRRIFLSATATSTAANTTPRHLVVAIFAVTLAAFIFCVVVIFNH